MSESFDVIVVGAGPAGAAAALTAAEGGLSVLLIERGEYVGAKNTTGGMLLAQVLGELVPNYWEEAPLERPVQHQRIMMSSGDRVLSVDIGNSSFLEPPYNGFSVLRRDFDQWLARKAQDAGALLITSTVVDDLLCDEGGRVIGVRTRRDDGEIYAKVVILADGINSLLARKAGLRGPYKPHDVALGVKELLALPAEVINQRFGLEGNAGAAYACIGDFARGISGGAFIYTNKESVSIGVVVQPEALADQGLTPHEVLERFKARPEIARLIKDGELLEYSGHLIGEGGYNAMSRLYGGGVMVAGDAAGFCVNTGIVLMGLNLALDSGRCAGKAAVSAIKEGDCTEKGLKVYKNLLSRCSALTAMEVHKDAPKLMTCPRMFNEYPDIVNNVLERMVTVVPGPRQGLMSIAKDEISKVKKMDLLRDVMAGGRAL